MTTLRRILMATAQEQPVVTEAEPKKKHARRRFDEEKELHFDHGRNGYKRKRKDMSNGSGNDRNHRDKDKSQPKRKLERSPSEKEVAEKPKPKLKKAAEKKKVAHGSHKISKTEAKAIPNGLDKKKKKKRPDIPVDLPADRPAAKIKKVDAAKPKPPPPAKKEKTVSNKPAVAEELEPGKKAETERKPAKEEPKGNADAPQDGAKVERKTPQSKPIEKPTSALVTKQAKKEVKEETKPREAVVKPVKEESVEVTKTGKEPAKAKKPDLKQGTDEALEPPPPPAEKPVTPANEPAKPKTEKQAENAVSVEKPKAEVAKAVKPEVKPSVVPAKKSSSPVGSPKPELKSAEKKRKREEENSPKEKSQTTAVAHRPPKRIASMKCPGTNSVEGVTKAEETKDSADDKRGVQEQEGNKAWVQCERCKEWFVLPSSINPASLPDHWYCEMKTWGAKNSKCCPQEKDSKRGTRPVQVQANGKKRSRAGVEKNARSSHNQRKARNQVQSTRPRIHNIMPTGSMGETPLKANPRSSWKWVLCETCNQWRKVPPDVDLDKLPEKWYCSMNKWDPARASCSAPQEADDAQSQNIKTVSSKKFVTLPDGVNMYGGQVWPVQKKQSPMNYRELIVNHYRNFKQWEMASSKVLNQRYDGTSLFVPRDVVRVKNSKSGNRKSLAANSKGNCISRSAAIDESLFSKLFPEAEPSSSQEQETSREDEQLQGLLSSSPNAAGLLKLSKPWKRVKWDWKRVDFCRLGKSSSQDST